MASIGSISFSLTCEPGWGRSSRSTWLAHAGSVLAALIGADVGPIITPFGSLATMLVLALAQREGEEVRSGRLVMLGLWAAPVMVVATTLVLTLTFALAR